MVYIGGPLIQYPDCEPCIEEGEEECQGHPQPDNPQGVCEFCADGVPHTHVEENQ